MTIHNHIQTTAELIKISTGETRRKLMRYYMVLLGFSQGLTVEDNNLSVKELESGTILPSTKLVFGNVPTSYVKKITDAFVDNKAILFINKDPNFVPYPKSSSFFNFQKQLYAVDPHNIIGPQQTEYERDFLKNHIQPVVDIAAEGGYVLTKDMNPPVWDYRSEQPYRFESKNDILKKELMNVAAKLEEIAQKL